MARFGCLRVGRNGDDERLALEALEAREWSHCFRVARRRAANRQPARAELLPKLGCVALQPTIIQLRRATELSGWQTLTSARAGKLPPGATLRQATLMLAQWRPKRPTKRRRLSPTGRSSAPYLRAARRTKVARINASLLFPFFSQLFSAPLASFTGVNASKAARQGFTSTRN